MLKKLYQKISLIIFFDREKWKIVEKKSKGFPDDSFSLGRY
jgi:hypothetical protein